MKPATPSEEKIRPFFAPIILGMAALFVLLVIAFPQFNRLKTDNQVLSDRQKAITVLQTKLSSLEALDETSQADTLDTALAALPLEEPFRESLLNLDTLLIRHQIGVSQIKVEPAADNLSIKFTSLGPLSGIRNFIADADKILPISATAFVETARIQDEIASDSAFVYQAEIVVKIFFQPPPTTIGRVSDPLPQITADHLKTLGLLTGFERISPPLPDSSSEFTAAPRLFPE